MLIDEQLSSPTECCEQVTRACSGQPFFRERDGRRYCVLHFPGIDKVEAFEEALKKKVESKDFNFQAIWFPNGVRFSDFEFPTDVDFSYSVFNGRASFHQAVFKAGANFDRATFNEAPWFERSIFKTKVKFSSTKFQKDANFRNSRFEGYADFWRCRFYGRADFDYAVFLQTASFWPTIFDSIASFSNAKFVRANFRASEFKDRADFSWCPFGFAEFIDASFSRDADFFSARFEGMANFVRATFASSARLTMTEFGDEARFASAVFNGNTDFSYSVFKSFVSFSGEYGIGGFGDVANCDFRHARFELPRRVSFHSVTLRPHWLIDLDPQEFELVDVKWINNLSRKSMDIELTALQEREGSEKKKAREGIAERLKTAEQYHDEFELERLRKELADDTGDKSNNSTTKYNRLLSITCRQLAVNAEENHRYDEASSFRFWSMELRRKEGWKARGKLTVGILHSLYRYLSGYGEEIGRALVVLVGIWLFFGLLIYTQVGFAQREPGIETTYRLENVAGPQRPIKALAYSLEIMTLQQPEPKPLTSTAKFAVLLERIIGPIQAALLALAIRRRFMR